jgi:hypothetical protein
MQKGETGFKALQEGLYQLSEVNKFRSHFTDSRKNGTYSVDHGTFTVLSFKNQHNKDKKQQSGVWPECTE